MSKSKRLKKKAKQLGKIEIVVAPKYVSEEQKDAVKAIVTFLLEFCKEEGFDCVSQETLQLAVTKYVDLVDADETPGTSALCRIRGSWENEE